MRKLLALLFLIATGITAEEFTGDVDILGALSIGAPLSLATGLANPAHAEGRVFYDDTNKAVSYYNDISDVSMQIGHEMWLRVKNNTAAQIDNGSAVYITGDDAGVPTIALAKADNPDTGGQVIGLATHDIAIGATGIVTTVGDVRDFDTSTLTAGTPVYLDASTAGGLTSTRPLFPDYVVRVGICTISDASAGEMSVSVIGTAEDIIINSFNGAIMENTSFAVASNGTTITGSLEKSGGGDLTLLFSDGLTVIDTTPATTIALTPGTDIAPQINYIYILKSTKALALSTVGFPASEHMPIATVLCQSAATLQTDNAHKVHIWTDHIATAGDNGHLSHVNAWIRSRHATWISGAGLTPTITTNGGALDNVDVSTASGSVYQLHPHDFPAFDTGVSSDVFIVNESAAAYTKIQDLNAANKDDAGNAIGQNQHTNLVIWGAASEDATDCKLYVNLPSGFHGNSPADAVSDPEKLSNYNIPAAFKGVGFLIARLTLKYTTASSGTWTLVENLDLRGQFPSIFAGGSAATTTVFPDSSFLLFDNLDNTKEVAFQASGITTGTTRTLTVPDKSGTLALLDDVDTRPILTTHSGATSGAVALDGSSGQTVKVTLTGAATLSVTGLALGQIVTLWIDNPSAYTVTNTTLVTDDGTDAAFDFNVELYQRVTIQYNGTQKMTSNSGVWKF